MDSDYERLRAYLIDLGLQDIPHYPEGGPSLLTHSLGVYHLMRTSGCAEEVCWAGMFHQIYGVEGIPVFQLSLECREEVAALIGERAERLVYLHCAMVRASFDRALEGGAPPYRLTDRFTRKEIGLDREDFDDLCRVHLSDWLEQVVQLRKWDYRRSAYQRMAERLGTVAQERFASAYAQETA